MWRAGLLIAMLTVYSTGTIAQQVQYQLQFYAAQGTRFNPLSGERTYDFIPLQRLSGGGPNNSQVQLNLMFINRPGQLQQPVRSVLFVFEPVPLPPAGTPNALVRILADPAQASNNFTVESIELRTEIGFSARVMLSRFQARCVRNDQQGNETEQQGTVVVEVLDFHPGLSFRRAVPPNTPRDRIRFFYFEGSEEAPTFRFPTSGVYEAQISVPPTQADFFVHGRDVILRRE